MIIQALAFYLFSIVLVGAAAMVVVTRNPVHSVFYLILAFFNAAGLFVLMGAEFLAMILVVVYVGAVAVLFLFVVMMLDVDFARLREGFARYLPVGGVIGLVLLVELVLIGGSWAFAPGIKATIKDPIAASHVPNTVALGLVLYTKYVYLFQGAGMVLLVAMIGAIVLTLRHREGTRRQRIALQVARNPKRAVEVRKVPVGGGVG